MGQYLIEYCMSNSVSALDWVELELQYPGLTVLEQECISECTLCREIAYVYYNGEILSNESPHNLLKMIEARIISESQEEF